jgi:hypothetical protein
MKDNGDGSQNGQGETLDHDAGHESLHEGRKERMDRTEKTSDKSEVLKKSEKISYIKSKLPFNGYCIEQNALFCLFYHFYIYSHVYTLFEPPSLPPLPHPASVQFC